MAGDAAGRARVRSDITPLVANAKPAAPGPPNLTDLSGHAPLYDLAILEKDGDLEAFARKAADSMIPQSIDTQERFRTEEMFYAPFLLSRVAARTGEDRYGSPLGAFLIANAAKLQREDGVFMHATGSNIAWGRANGFAALGLSEALVNMPASWPSRAALVEIAGRQMRGLMRWQASDGMWREIIDEPGSYREMTATTMIVTALARGIRMGWLDAREFRPILDRAWTGVLARIGDDGGCLTRVFHRPGPDKQYYLDRQAVIGFDDRGGGMALTAALEMAELTTAR